MISEWMKVMLEEISRKRTEAQQARVEEQQRIEEQQRREEVDLSGLQVDAVRAEEIRPEQVLERADGPFAGRRHEQRGE